MIVLVACPIAAAIRCVKSKCWRIEDEHIARKICGVQTDSCTTLGPARINTVLVCQALAAANIARMKRCTSSLTTVILGIPEATPTGMKAEAVVIATLEEPITIVIVVAIPITLLTHASMVFIAAVFSSITVHWNPWDTFYIDKYLSTGHAWRWVFQITNVRQLA
jgi:hypothetical protein